MKISAIILFLLVPMVTVAQNYQDMNEADMQKMKQQMQKMESCMKNVDQSKLNEIQQRSTQFEAERKSLCADGKRDQAQEKAMSFGKKMAKDPAVQAMRKCSEMMIGTMPMMPYMDQVKDRSRSSDHVCD